MRTAARPVVTVSLALTGALALQLAIGHFSGPSAEQDFYARTPIPLRFSRALSTRFTKAHGLAEVNFTTGQISISVEDLDPVDEGSAYEVWLVDNGPGPDNTVAIDSGPHGDRILKVGVLPATGALVASVGADRLADFDIDLAAVMHVAPGRAAEFVIGGMQSIRFRIGREAMSRGSQVLAAGLGPAPAPEPGQGRGKKNVDNLIEQGRILFAEETFGGNGRTCATCHRMTDDQHLTINVDFIDSLSRTDPLFLAETNPALPPFDEANPTRPAFESPLLMRRNGLILENIDGFDRDQSGNLLRPPVFRMTPALFNLEFTAPYGDSACCADLQLFSVGAVVQHFPRSLNRIPGVDFVLPTAEQLQALEAFQLSNTSPASGNFSVSGRNSLLSTSTDRRATNTTRAEVRGRDLFLATNSCVTCHIGPVFGGDALNLDTGVEEFGQNIAQTPTLDDGDDLGQFQVPTLFGLRKSHFFHNGIKGRSGDAPRRNLIEAVRFYTSPEFELSPMGQLRLPDGSLRFQQVLDMTDAQLEDIAAFLEAISVE